MHYNLDERLNFGKHKNLTYRQLPDNYRTWLVMSDPSFEWLLNYYPLCGNCKVVHAGNCMDRIYKCGRYADVTVSYNWIKLNDKPYYRWLSSLKGHEWLQ